jgi:hypothetical protein
VEEAIKQRLKKLQGKRVLQRINSQNSKLIHQFTKYMDKILLVSEAGGIP